MRIAIFFILILSLSAHASNLTEVLSKDDARQLANLVQAPGLEKFIGDQAKEALAEKIGSKMEGWVAGILGEERAKNPGEIFKNNPEISKKVKAELQRRLQEWLPGEAKKILADNNFLSDDVAKEVVASLNRSLNDSADKLLDHWYEQLVTHSLGSNLSDKLGDLIGQSTARSLQNNIIQGLHGELPDEALQFLRQGPDQFAAYVDKARVYLPSTQFKRMRDRAMNIHIVDLPNQAYGAILGVSAALHMSKFVSSCSAFGACDWNELKRFKEVTQTMLWQLRNKKFVSLTLGDFFQMGKLLGDQLGSFNWPPFQQMAKWNPANVLKNLDDIEARLKKIDKLYDQATGKVLDGFNQSIAELQKKMKELSEKMLGPFKKPMVCMNGILPGDCSVALDPPDLTKWAGLKKTLGLEEGIFGKAGDKKPIEEISKGAADVAVKISDKLHITGLLAEILKIEKVPAKNVSMDSDFDPVFLHNGEFYYTATDVTLPGGLQLTRIFRARSDFVGVLGYHWTTNLNERLLRWDNPDAGPGLTYIDAEGKKWFFKEEGGGFYTSPADLGIELHKAADGFEMTFADHRQHLFDAKGFLKTIHDSRGSELQLNYNDEEQLVQVVDTSNHALSFYYRSDGLLDRVEDQTGRVWKYSYNDEQELIAATSPGTPNFPKGKSTRYRYHDHKMTMIMDPKGQIYLENYYADSGVDIDKVIAQKYGGEFMTEARYDGLTTWVIDRRGVMHKYEHDEEGELIQREVPLTVRPELVEGRTVSQYQYDSWGNIIAIHDEQGNDRRFEVDATNLITKEIANSEERRYKYDANDNIVQIDVPARNLKLEFEYDVLDRLTAKKEILNGSHTIATRYEYDPQGRLTRYVYPLGNDVRFVYNENGSLVEKIRGEGTLERSAMSLRATEERSNLPLPPWEIASPRYGGVRNDIFDPLGRPTQIDQIKMEWDDNNRLASLTDEQGRTTNYFYDSLNRLVLEKFSDGSEKSYAYDTADQITGMIDQNSNAHVWKYDPSGNLILRESKNFRQTFRYSAEGRLIEAVDGDVSVELAYDDQGRLTGEKMNGRWVTKSFDKQNQKTGITYPNGLEVVRQYQDGKLTGLFAGDHPIPLAEDQVEEAPQELNAPLPQNIRRDAASNLLEDDGFVYQYDPLNRLILVQDKKSNEIINFKYDAFGRLAQKEKSKEKIDYFYDDLNLIASISTTGAKNNYIYSADLDRPAAFFKEKELYFYQLDPRGSVRSITNSKGEVVEQYGYLPFGEMTVSKTQESGNELGFIGRPFDFEGRLVNLRHRFYSSSLHEFLTADPLGYKNNFYAASNIFVPKNISYHQGQGGASRTTFPNHIEQNGETLLLDTDLFYARENRAPQIPETNLFAYAGGDPLNYYDPLGLYKIDVALPRWGETPSENLRDMVGTLSLQSDDGRALAGIGPFKVLGRSSNNYKNIKNGPWIKNDNRNRDPLFVRGDTPTGIYRVGEVAPKTNVARYGPYGAIPITPLEGQATLAFNNGRRGLLIHGGEEKQTTFGDSLLPTLGCLRLHNDDLSSLIQGINRLKKEGDTDGLVEVKEF